MQALQNYKKPKQWSVLCFFVTLIYLWWLGSVLLLPSSHTFVYLFTFYSFYLLKVLFLFPLIVKGCWLWICWGKEARTFNVYETISCCWGPQSLWKGLCSTWILNLLISYLCVPVSVGAWVWAGACACVVLFLQIVNCCMLVQRRRDRINEKMRALQELIPRCNKVVVHIKFIILIFPKYCGTVFCIRCYLHIWCCS